MKTQDSPENRREDGSQVISYDYVVACLLRHELRFSLPEDFAVTEIDLNEEVGDASVEYRTWFREALAYINKADLLKA